MERLSLPEPARTMWKRIRGVVNDLVPGNDSCKAFLTGGTLLAARWKHRRSTDIDVFVTGLEDLSPIIDDPENRIWDRIDGKPERVGENRQLTISMKDGRLDIAARKPLPERGSTAALVDGREQLVFSNAQILSGKISRLMRGFIVSRDVYDIMTAGERGMDELTKAWGQFPREKRAPLEAVLDTRNEAIHEQCSRELDGIAFTNTIPADIGSRTARFLKEAEYSALKIEVVCPDRTEAADHASRRDETGAAPLVRMSGKTTGGTRIDVTIRPEDLAAECEYRGAARHLVENGIYPKTVERTAIQMAACGIYGTLTDTYAIQPGETLARIRTELSGRGPERS